MDVKNRSIEKIVKGTGILIFGLEGPEPKANLLDEEGNVTSCPRGLSHPDIGIRLTMAHRMTPCEGGTPIMLPSGTCGYVLGAGDSCVFRVYGQDRKFEDYTISSLQGTIEDDDAVILTNIKTGKSWIYVSLD